MSPEERLTAHLSSWLGAWPPPGPGVTVVGSERRTTPGWSGGVRVVAGVEAPDGTVLSVPPEYVEAVRALGPELDDVAAGIAEAVERPAWLLAYGIFRWTGEPSAGPDDGVWLPTDDRRVPEWLRPFNGDVLVGFEGDQVAAGVGRKQHDPCGHELAVVTEEGFRGQGWAVRLVAQAARRVLADGAVPTYLHAPENVASARTADAAGFPDRGWRVIGLFEEDPG